MLKLNVMRFNSFWMLLILLTKFWFSGFPQLDLVRFQFPSDGEVIKGNVQIIGSITGENLQYADISFSYQNSETDTWFLIASVDTTITDDVIAAWDTSTIADGFYQLRIQAHYDNGDVQDSLVKDIQVRNYSAVDPIQVDEIGSLQVETTPDQSIVEITTATLEDTPTPMPASDLMVTRSQFFMTVIQSAIFGILLLIVAVLFIIIRRRKLG